MPKALCALLLLVMSLPAVELPTKKTLNLAAIKTMVAGAEAEAATRKCAGDAVCGRRER
jgi:hypothetical protein